MVVGVQISGWIPTHRHGESRWMIRAGFNDAKKKEKWKTKPGCETTEDLTLNGKIRNIYAGELYYVANVWQLSQQTDERRLVGARSPNIKGFG